MHSIELFLSLHAWGTLLVGLALPYVLLIGTAIVCGMKRRTRPTRQGKTHPRACAVCHSNSGRIELCVAGS